jgi:ABC-type glycerol-3-phosphate transport system substrate-binding protein
MNRRDFLRIGMLTTAGGVLAACAPQAAATSEAAQSGGSQPPTAIPTEVPTAVAVGGGQKELVYWTQWAAGYPDKCWGDLAKIPEFQEYLGAYKLSILNKSEDNLVTAIAAGTPPDCGANYNYLDYMARDVCLPIDDLFAASKHFKHDDFLEPVWAVSTYKGKIYGMPCNESFVRYGMMINTRLVKAAGLDPEKVPTTWDEMLEWHKTLTIFDNAKNLKVVGFDPVDFMMESVWSTDGWAPGVSWGFTYYDEKANTFNLACDQMIDYLATHKKFMDVIGADNLTGLHSAEGQGTWGPGFDAQVETVVLQGYWACQQEMVSKPEIVKDLKYDWIPVPASRKGVKTQLAGGHTLLTFKGTKVPEGTYAIQEFCNTKGASDVIFKDAGFLPAVKSYLDSFDTSSVPGLDFFFKSSKEATEWHAPEQCPIVNFVGKTFVEDREKVARGQMSPEEAAKDLQDRCTEELRNAGFAS